MSSITPVTPPPASGSGSSTPGTPQAAPNTVQPTPTSPEGGHSQQGGNQQTPGQSQSGNQTPGQAQGGQQAGAGQPAAARTPVAATLLSAPPNLPTLAAGDRLLGTVIAHAAGRLTVQTPAGPVQLQTAAALPDGTPVAIAARGTGGTVQLTVQAVPQAAAQSAPAAVPNAPTVAPGAVVTANVAQLSAPGPALPRLDAAGAPTGQSAPLSAHGTVQARVLSIVPPGSSGAAPAPAATGSAPVTVTGTVIGATAHGQPVVRSGLGVLVLNAGAAPQTGSSVQLELQGLVRAPAPAAPAVPSRAPLAADWPALRDGLAVLTRADPAAARGLMAALPQPNGQLSASLLFLLSAVSGGDPRGLFGDRGLRALQSAGRGDLVSRLGEDFAALQRLSDPIQAHEWRAFFLPFVNGERVEQIRLFLHRKRAQRDRPDRQGSRFVLEFELSELGAFQVDGLVHDDEERRFDLIVRTHAPLPDEVREGIGEAFTNSASAAGFGGSLVFQAVAEFPVAPLEELGALPPGAPCGVVV